jgi:hypothetical protein
VDKNGLTNGLTNAQYLKQLRVAAVAAGKCYVCRARPVREGRRMCQRCYDAANKRGKESRKAYLAVGLCGCGNDPGPGQSRCLRCVTRKRQAAQKRRAELAATTARAKRLRAAGMCTMCGCTRERGAPKGFCLTCYAKWKRSQAKRVAKAKASGLCLVCCRRKRVTARFCHRCRKKHNVGYAARRVRRIHEGRCARCNGERDRLDRSECGGCRLRDAKRHASRT